MPLQMPQRVSDFSNFKEGSKRVLNAAIGSVKMRAWPSISNLTSATFHSFKSKPFFFSSRERLQTLCPGDREGPVLAQPGVSWSVSPASTARGVAATRRFHSAHLASLV